MFTGKINRKNFFLYTILHGLLIVGVGWLITHSYLSMFLVGPLKYIISSVFTIMGLFILISLLSLVVRRINDIKMSRWKIILIFIPIINIFFSLYLLLTPGAKDNDVTAY